jgi:hypothetical protein
VVAVQQVTPQRTVLDTDDFLLGQPQQGPLHQQRHQYRGVPREVEKEVEKEKETITKR